MAATFERYRKLPGHRRGLLRGSSVWMGADHLLLVKSVRFREEYKRFFLRDIQAIVVAEKPRFHISSRSLAIGILWLAVYLFARSRAQWIPMVLWTSAVLLVGIWLYVSYGLSCSCRIITAVSRDQLPSIYRTWIARRFLAEVEPRIREVQGTVQEGWAEALEDRPIGPTFAVPAGTVPSAASSGLPAPLRSATAVSAVFTGSLFADGILNLATLHSLTHTTQWIWYALALVQVASAVMIFVQHHRGMLSVGMQRLAIVALIAMGASYYARQVATGVTEVFRASVPDVSVIQNSAAYTVIREVDAAICLALGVVGLVLGFGAKASIEAPPTIASGTP